MLAFGPTLLMHDSSCSFFKIDSFLLILSFLSEKLMLLFLNCALAKRFRNDCRTLLPSCPFDLISRPWSYFLVVFFTIYLGMFWLEFKECTSGFRVIEKLLLCLGFYSFWLFYLDPWKILTIEDIFGELFFLFRITKLFVVKLNFLLSISFSDLIYFEILTSYFLCFSSCSTSLLSSLFK